MTSVRPASGSPLHIPEAAWGRVTVRGIIASGIRAVTAGSGEAYS